MSMFIKLTFILFFILFSIFLAYEEYTLSNNKSLHSSNPLYRNLRDLLGVTSGIAKDTAANSSNIANASNASNASSSNINNFWSNGDNSIDKQISDLYSGVLDTFKSVLEPVTVNYSNEVLSNQLYGMSITLFILSIIIIILLIVFLVNIISFIYSEKLLKYITNKYFVKYISFNREIIKIEIIFVGIILIYFMYHLAFGLHFLATHPIIF